MSNKSNNQMLSDKQFIAAIAGAVTIYIFILILAITFAHNAPKDGEFNFQLSDIVGILMLSVIGYAPLVLFPASIVSFKYVQKRKKSMRWPLTFVALGIICVVIRTVLSLFSSFA